MARREVSETDKAHVRLLIENSEELQQANIAYREGKALESHWLVSLVPGVQRSRLQATEVCNTVLITNTILDTSLTAIQEWHSAADSISDVLEQNGIVEGISEGALSASLHFIPGVGAIVGLASTTVGAFLYLARWHIVTKKVGSVEDLKANINRLADDHRILRHQAKRKFDRLQTPPDNPRDAQTQQLELLGMLAGLEQSEQKIQKLRGYISTIENDLLWAKVSFATLALTTVATILFPPFAVLVPEISSFFKWMITGPINGINATVTAEGYQEDLLREVPRDQDIVELLTGAPVADIDLKDQAAKEREYQQLERDLRTHQPGEQLEFAKNQAKIAFFRRKIAIIRQYRQERLAITTEADTAMRDGKRFMALGMILQMVGFGLCFLPGVGTAIGLGLILGGSCLRLYGSYFKTYRGRAKGHNESSKAEKRYGDLIEDLNKCHPGSPNYEPKPRLLNSDEPAPAPAPVPVPVVPAPAPAPAPDPTPVPTTNKRQRRIVPRIGLRGETGGKGQRVPAGSSVRFMPSLSPLSSDRGSTPISNSASTSSAASSSRSVSAPALS